MNGKLGLMAIAAAALICAACVAPTNAELMELNRSGKWKQAESAAKVIIKAPGALNEDGLHETYFHLMYAQLRLGKNQEAKATAAAYDEFLAISPLPAPLLWMEREVAKVKDELGILSEPQRLLVAAMEANYGKDYQKAMDLADKAAAAPDATDVQKATAALLAAGCETRLGNAAAAEKRLASFDALKKALPRGHTALRDEPPIRDALSALKAGDRPRALE